MQIKVLGLYIVAILALLRFLIYPLHSTLQERKVLLGEQYETYQIRTRILDQQKGSLMEKNIVGRDALSPYLYQGKPNSYIQSNVLEKVIKMAEAKGLAVLNFEMLEPVAGKRITELPVLIRLKGEAGPFIEVLEEIEKSKKIIAIRSLEITRSEPNHLFALTLSTFKMEI
jgi:Tfp pilus assembly protein PilO